MARIMDEANKWHAVPSGIDILSASRRSSEPHLCRRYVVIASLVESNGGPL